MKMKAVEKSLMTIVLISLGASVACLFLTQEMNKKKQLRHEVELVKQKAASGDPQSEVELGKAFYYGRGVPQSYVNASRWNLRAAATGNSQAEYVLGVLYERGEGVPQSYLDAFSWYEKAANQGHVLAQVGLGMLYYQGLGVHQDFYQAANLYRRAAEKESADAEYLLGYSYQYGQGVPQSNSDAAMWYIKASRQGNASAERALGLRGGGLRRLDIVIIVILAAAWGSVANHLVASREPLALRRKLQSIAAVACGLIYVAMRSVAIFGGFHSFKELNIFHLCENLSLGVAVGFAIHLSSRISNAEKLVLGLAVSSFISFALFVAFHSSLWCLSSGDQRVLPLGTLLLGVSTPLMVTSLWKGDA